MAFYFKAYATEHGCGSNGLLGGGVVQDVRPDRSRVDHDAIYERISREWQGHHPHCYVHVEEVPAEEYGPLYCGLPQFNTID